MKENIENLELIQRALMHLMCEDDIYYNDNLYKQANDSYTGLVILKKKLERELQIDTDLEDFLNEQ